MLLTPLCFGEAQPLVAFFILVKRGFGTNHVKNETIKPSYGCLQDRKILRNCEWKACQNI